MRYSADQHGQYAAKLEQMARRERDPDRKKELEDHARSFRMLQKLAKTAHWRHRPERSTDQQSSD
jgi:hypothetical protein